MVPRLLLVISLKLLAHGVAGRGERCDLKRVSSSALEAMSDDESFDALNNHGPMIVTGAAEGWAALTKWRTPAAFASHYGAERIPGKAKHVLVGREQESVSMADVAPEAGAGREHAIMYVRSRLVLSRLSTYSLAPPLLVSHPLLYLLQHTSYDYPGHEESLHDALGGDWAIPSYLASASVQRTLSLGGKDRGPTMQSHQVAWLALVQGRKFWSLGDPSEPKPKEPTCDYETDRQDPRMQCVIHPGELLYLPERWWHSTCNQEKWTIGVGGQGWKEGSKRRAHSEAEWGARTIAMLPAPADDSQDGGRDEVDEEDEDARREDDEDEL